MGRLLVALARDDERLRVAAAVEAPGHPAVGRDAGELAGGGALGVRVSDALAAVCARWEVPLKAAALQFPLRHPAVGSVVVGCRSPAEVDEDVGLFGLPIPAGLWEELAA